MNGRHLAALGGAFLLAFCLSMPVGAAEVTGGVFNDNVVLDFTGDADTPGIHLSLHFLNLDPVWINFEESISLGSGPHPFTINVTNQSSTLWTDFHYSIQPFPQLQTDTTDVFPQAGDVIGFEQVGADTWIYLEPFPVGGFQAVGTYQNVGGLGGFSLHLQPSVPIPAALWLFVSAIGFLCWKRPKVI